MFRELGVVERLDIVPHFGPLDRLLGQLAIAKVVAVGEVALVYLLCFVLVRNLEEGLANVILPLNLFICETMADDAEEPGVVYLLGY